MPKRRSDRSNRSRRKSTASSNKKKSSQNQNTLAQTEGIQSDDLEIIAAFLAVAADVFALLSLLKAREESEEGEGEEDGGLALPLVISSTRGRLRRRVRRRPR